MRRSERDGHRLKAVLRQREVKCARERGSNVPGGPVTGPLSEK